MQNLPTGPANPSFIYLYGICSCDALLALLVAQDNEGPTIFVERERSGKAHGFLVKKDDGLARLKG